MIFAVSDPVKYLVFPIAVLLTGAIVSGLLIPALARRRDGHQKALEVKSELVADASEAVMEFVMAIQFAFLGASGQDQDAYDQAYKTWETKSAVLGTKLEAYFIGSSIGREWTDFAGRVTWFYGLTDKSDPERHLVAAKGLLREYHLDWPPAEDASGRQQDPWTVAWGQLKDAILDEKSRLIRTILRERVVAFEGTPLLRRLRPRHWRDAAGSA